MLTDAEPGHELRCSELRCCDGYRLFGREDGRDWGRDGGRDAVWGVARLLRLAVALWVVRLGSEMRGLRIGCTGERAGDSSYVDVDAWGSAVQVAVYGEQTLLSWPGLGTHSCCDGEVLWRKRRGGAGLRVHTLEGSEGRSVAEDGVGCGWLLERERGGRPEEVEAALLVLARGRMGCGDVLEGDEGLREAERGGAPSGMAAAHAATPLAPFPAQSSAWVTSGTCASS